MVLRERLIRQVLRKTNSETLRALSEILKHHGHEQVHVTQPT